MTKLKNLAFLVTSLVEGEYTGAFSELFPRIYCFDLLQLDINFASLPFHVKACLVHPDLVQLMLTSVDKKTRRKYLSMLDKVSNSSLAPDDWQAVDRFIPSALAEYAGPYTKRRHVII